MPDSATNIKAPVTLVAIAGWLIPGAGYWLIGQRHRAMATGFAVIAIYLAGLLIGGVRVIEVPGYNESGEMVTVRVNRVNNPDAWVMQVSPLQEIKGKPWSIAQILAGPMGIASGAASVWAAQPDMSNATENAPLLPHAKITHTPVNEAGTLYTAVAGMLNLLVIIDASHRASHREDE